MDYEFDEMRQQMAILKDKLENQTIVNDRFIRRSIKRSVGTINRRYLVLGIVALAMIPYGYWAFVMLNGLSVALWLTMCVLMLIVVGFMYFNSRDLRDNDLMGGNLLDVKRKVTLAKKRDANWLWFGIPAGMLWFGWFMYEESQKAGFSQGILLILLISMIVGLIVGLMVHFKTQRHFRDTIDQLEDLENTK